MDFGVAAFSKTIFPSKPHACDKENYCGDYNYSQTFYNSQSIRSNASKSQGRNTFYKNRDYEQANSVLSYPEIGMNERASILGIPDDNIDDRQLNKSCFHKSQKRAPNHVPLLKFLQESIYNMTSGEEQHRIPMKSLAEIKVQ